MILYIFLVFCASPILAYPNQRIIGGANATAGQFPFMAAIYKTTPEGEYFCAGSLITKQWIITAGQCVDGATLFTIHFNCLRLSDANYPIATESYVLHPEYDPTTLANDLGLIKLREPVILGTYVHPFNMPDADVVPTSTGLAIGWGQTSDANSDLSNHLMYVSLTHVTDDECRITYGGQITETMACFEGNFNEGTCFGDSGSPLVQVVNNRAEVVIAIASFFSANGCESTDPSGYTTIFPYIDWIKNVTADESV